MMNFGTHGSPHGALSLIRCRRDLFRKLHREVRYMSGRYTISTFWANARGELFVEVHVPACGMTSIRVLRPQLRALVYASARRHLRRSLDPGCPGGDNEYPPIRLVAQAETLLRSKDVPRLCKVMCRWLALRALTKPSTPLWQHPTFALYCQMKRVGIPRDAIVQRMTVDGQRQNINILSLDPYGPAPTKDRLNIEQKDVLVLSRDCPEEHWRLLYRGQRVTRGGVPIVLEVLERQSRFWVRTRRETSIESAWRREREERQEMWNEEKLARAVIYEERRINALYARRRRELALKRLAHAAARARRADAVRRANAFLKRRNRLSELAHGLARAVNFHDNVVKALQVPSPSTLGTSAATMNLHPSGPTTLSE